MWPLLHPFSDHYSSALQVVDLIYTAVSDVQKDLEGCTLDTQRFKLFWLNISCGRLTLGTSLAGCGTLVQLQAPKTGGPVYIGLLSWDTSVAFRNVLANPPLRCLTAPGQLQPRQDSLLAKALAVLPTVLTVHTVCLVLARMNQMWGAAVPQWAECVHYLTKNFTSVLAANPDGFLLLPQLAFAQVLSFGGVTVSEHTLFLALQSWAFGCVLPAEIEAAQADSQPLKVTCSMVELNSMLQHVRFPLMTHEQLERVYSSPLATMAPSVKELVREAHEAASHSDTCYRVEGLQEDIKPENGTPSASNAPESPSANSAPKNILQNGAPSASRAPKGPRKRRHFYTQAELRSLWRMQPRCPPDTAELLYLHDGDHRGVMHFIGTGYAQSSQFVNPYLTGGVTVWSSSPFHSNSKPSHLTSPEYHRATCALPDATGSALWAVHFNGGHKLACTHYTMRANGSKALPRAWELQGRCEDEPWLTLHSLHGDESLSQPGMTASWAVDSKGTPKFHTDFRVVLTGPTLGGGSVLNIEYLELYGYFWYKAGNAGAEKHTG